MRSRPLPSGYLAALLAAPVLTEPATDPTARSLAADGPGAQPFVYPACRWETVTQVAGLSQRPHGEDTSHGSSWYTRRRAKLRLAHEVSWIGAWFIGGGIALMMGHPAGGLAGMACGGFFAALSLAAASAGEG